MTATPRARETHICTRARHFQQDRFVDLPPASRVCAARIVRAAIICTHVRMHRIVCIYVCMGIVLVA